jgi:hypothetical protein
MNANTEVFDAFQALAMASMKIEQLAGTSAIEEEDRRHLQGKLSDVTRFLLERVVDGDADRGAFSAFLETIRRRTLAPTGKRRRR